jgi:hypothetical protein
MPTVDTRAALQAAPSTHLGWCCHHMQQGRSYTALLPNTCRNLPTQFLGCLLSMHVPSSDCSGYDTKQPYCCCFALTAPAGT